MTIDEAYRYCRAIAHKHGANFSVGFRFLPRRKRRAVYAAYAYCRWADDIADEGAREHAFEDLGKWQAELDACYAGAPGHPITIALADALQHFAIPKSAFVALIDGCRQDMFKTRYETFDELLQYCALVAWSISDISLAIYGHRTDAALDHGRNLATALQLTNVTRDIGDDLGRNRVYIPQEELRRFGVTERDLFDRVESEGMRQLIEFQIGRAESYFRLAEPLLAELSFDARFPTVLMGGVYATVLARLRLAPLTVLRKRLSLSGVEKLMVVARRALRPHFVSLLLLFAGAAAARAAEAPQSVIVRVPVVGSVWGIGGVRWKTDVDLYNDSAHALTVRVSLPAADAPDLLFEIPAGATQRFGDIAEAFSMESALSPLEIETFETKRPVRVAATVYGVRGADILTPEPIPVDYGSGMYYPQRSLNGLSFSETFRTNIGLVNLGDHDATFVLALQRLAGRNLALTRITMQPNSLTHVSIQSLFPLITKGDDFSILVETGARDTYVYASVIDNETSEARFIQPAIGAPPPALPAQEMATHRP